MCHASRLLASIRVCVPPYGASVRYEVHADQRYRIVQISHGFLLSFTLRGADGLLLDAQEWLYRTREAAEKGFGFVVAMNAWWDAIASGCPADDVAEQCDTAAGEHARAWDLWPTSRSWDRR